MPQKLSQHLAAYLATEGKAAANEKVLDWLYNLDELASAGQNVSGIICDIEVACAANELNFKKLRQASKEELAADRVVKAVTP
jgi:hypothetical protein